jgi:hypothetical protein
MFERKNVNLKTLRQVARNTVDGGSALRVVIETNPGTIRLELFILIFERVEVNGFAWFRGC